MDIFDHFVHKTIVVKIATSLFVLGAKLKERLKTCRPKEF